MTLTQTLNNNLSLIWFFHKKKSLIISLKSLKRHLLLLVAEISENQLHLAELWSTLSQCRHPESVQYISLPPHQHNYLNVNAKYANHLHKELLYLPKASWRLILWLCWSGYVDFVLFLGLYCHQPLLFTFHNLVILNMTNISHQYPFNRKTETPNGNLATSNVATYANLS